MPVPEEYEEKNYLQNFTKFGKKWNMGHRRNH